MDLITTLVLALLLTLLLWYLQSLRKSPPPPPVSGGFVAKGWEEVEEVFRRCVQTARDSAQFSVYHKGVLVVNLAGGYADDEAGWTMGRDTLLFTASTIKAVSAFCIALLVDRGHLSYDKPVSRYWPEFAKNGKAEITVEQLLGHQGGLAALDEPRDFIDDKPEDTISSLARQKPYWPLGEHIHDNKVYGANIGPTWGRQDPGTGHGYHTFTMMPLMDQLVRLVDPKHRDLQRFFREEMGDKLGLEIYHGLPDSLSPRAARVYPAGVPLTERLVATRYWAQTLTLLTDNSSLVFRSFTNPARSIGGVKNHPGFKRHPHAGYATAEGLARLMGLLANGGDQTGTPVLSPEIIRRLRRPLVSGKDKVAMVNITYGPGVTLRETPSGGWMVGAPGAGGQMGFFDADAKLGWGYLRNHYSVYTFGDDPNYLQLERAMYECIRRIEDKT